jgi:hypothetical protein
VQGPGAVTHLDGSQVVVHTDAAGMLVVRVRYDPRWAVVAGSGCVRPGPGDWTDVSTARSGDLRLQLRLVGDRDTSCPPAQS